jgi:Sec-independent protein translocase protein TatA
MGAMLRQRMAMAVAIVLIVIVLYIGPRRLPQRRRFED